MQCRLHNQDRIPSSAFSFSQHHNLASGYLASISSSQLTCVPIMTTEKMENTPSSHAKAIPKDGEMVSLRGFDFAAEEGLSETHRGQQVLKRIDRW